jgi:hypothetical protein
MICKFEIREDQLRAALNAFEKAKERGFEHTSLVFHLSSIKNDGSDAKASFSDSVILKGHPTNPRKDWGACSTSQIDWYRLVDGKLVEGKVIVTND